MLRELTAIHRSDITFVVSPVEAVLLERCGIPRHKIAHIPVSYDAPWIAAASHHSSRPFHKRAHICMLGSFRHAGNVDAVQWLRATVWPAMRQELQARLGDGDGDGDGALPQLHVYGMGATREHMALHAPDEGFYMKGACKDQFETLGR